MKNHNRVVVSTICTKKCVYSEEFVVRKVWSKTILKFENWNNFQRKLNVRKCFQISKFRHAKFANKEVSHFFRTFLRACYRIGITLIRHEISGTLRLTLIKVMCIPESRSDSYSLVKLNSHGAACIDEFARDNDLLGTRYNTLKQTSHVQM